MKTLALWFFCYALTFCFTASPTFANPGDTIVVQTFTFNTGGDFKRGKFLFPPASKRFEKILMYYTLKCDPKQNPACGEWDYLTYTFLYQHTGVFDSTGEKINRYELGRFITPYGIGLDLGAGWTWVYDVSDFRPMLHDSVDIGAGNWQELLDLKFVMIEGTPPRDVIKIENLWVGDFALSQFLSKVPPKTVSIDPTAKAWRVRSTVTGHQFDNATNCAEFCPKTHSLNVNGTTRYSWQIIQECAMNALYPQGGTWIYDRAGWCPGMPATTQLLEITPWVSGNSVSLDYNSDYDDFGNYVTEIQLVSYSNPNFTREAELLEIISPSKNELNRRFNPSCGRPKIVIQNNGAEPLTSLTITYGPKGGASNTFQWTGNLKFLSKEEVTLPVFPWGNFSSENIFTVSLSQPNGGADESPNNNSRSVTFDVVPVYYGDLFVTFKTGNAAFENFYSVVDVSGKAVFNKAGMANNRTYRDTIKLQPGCYELILRDAADDGIDWWANRSQKGTGSCVLRLVGASASTTLNPDFGKEIRYGFLRANPVGVSEIPSAATDFDVYPNPTSDEFQLSFALQNRSSVAFVVYNARGQKVKEIAAESFDAGTHVKNLDPDDLPRGAYIISMLMNGKAVQTQNLLFLR